MTDVLAIGPHPDDIEISAGGTVALLAAAGFRVVLLDLTGGERSTRGTPDGRRQEAAAAAAALGAAGRECLALPDGGLSSERPEQTETLVAALRRHRPRLVIALHENDDHPDHVAAAHLVRRSAYLGGLRNYPGPGQETHRPGRVLFAMGRKPFVPSLVVDVSAHYDAKRAALHAFASQFFRAPDDPLVTPISEPGFLDRVEARDRHFGGMIGAAFGEAFHEDGPVPVRAAGGLLEGAAG